MMIFAGGAPMVMPQRRGAKNTHWFFLLSLAFSLGGCAGGPGSLPPPTQAASAAAPIAGAQMQTLAGHPGMMGKPLLEKIALGGEAVLDWQLKINRDYGQQVRPTRPAAGHPLIAPVHSMAAGLPPQVRRLAERHMVALYLVENDFGTGTTEGVRDPDGAWKLSYIVLNLTALGRTANEWGSWKEESSFRPAPGHQIRMVLAAPRDDTRQAAIRFIFLHELGHVIGLALGAHGWWDAESLPPETATSPFVTLSWRNDGAGKMVSRWRDSQPLLSKLAFYKFAQASLRGESAEMVYRGLEQTNFPSLYGATNLFDDFAETFAIYVHTRLLKSPYRVEVVREGAVRFTYRSCLQTGTCEKKARILEALLEGR